MFDFPSSHIIGLEEFFIFFAISFIVALGSIAISTQGMPLVFLV
jgi:hypothetical protein